MLLDVTSPHTETILDQFGDQRSRTGASVSASTPMTAASFAAQGAPRDHAAGATVTLHA